jgi:hypothetical protein
MAFFKRLKERVTKPKASISIVLKKYGFSLGEELAGTLCLRSEDEFDVDEIKVVAACVALVNKSDTGTSISFGSDGLTVDREEATSRSFDILWSTRVTVSNAFHCAVGHKQEVPFTVKLPESYKTAKGMIHKVKWSLKGVAVINKRPDVSSKEIHFNVADQDHTHV